MGNYLPAIDTLDDTPDNIKIIRAVATYISNGLQNNASLAEILESVDDLMVLVNDALTNNRNPATIGYLYTYDGPTEPGELSFTESLLTGASSSKTWYYYRFEDNGNTQQGTLSFNNSRESCVAAQSFTFKNSAPALPAPDCTEYLVGGGGILYGLNAIGLGEGWRLLYQGPLNSPGDNGDVMIAMNNVGHLFWLDSGNTLNAASDKTPLLNTPYFIFRDTESLALAVNSQVTRHTFTDNGEMTLDADVRNWTTLLLNSTGLFTSDLTATKTTDPAAINNDHYLLDYRVSGNFSLVYTGTVVPGGTDVQESLALWTRDQQAMDKLFLQWCLTYDSDLCPAN